MKDADLLIIFVKASGHISIIATVHDRVNYCGADDFFL